jgi:hypothetical protein
MKHSGKSKRKQNFNMFNSRLIHNLSVQIGFLSLLGLVNLALAESSSAQSRNRSFEDDPAFVEWMIIGDVSRQEVFEGILPPDGNFQALLTTATTNLQDDLPASAGTFNFSGDNPANENFASELEDFLGLVPNSLDAPVNSPFGATEGSGIQQTFTAQAGDIVQFNWNFLTNDAAAPFFGGSRDYAFVSLYPVSDGVGDNSDVLANSVSPSLISSATSFARETGYNTYTSDPLSAGDWVLGLGVVDGAGTDKTSALLLDSFTIVSPKVPEPSSLLGLFSVMLLGLCLRSKGQKKQ